MIIYNVQAKPKLLYEFKPIMIFVLKICKTCLKKFIDKCQQHSFDMIWYEIKYMCKGLWFGWCENEMSKLIWFIIITFIVLIGGWDIMIWVAILLLLIGRWHSMTDQWRHWGISQRMDLTSIDMWVVQLRLLPNRKPIVDFWFTVWWDSRQTKMLTHHEGESWCGNAACGETCEK